MWDDEVFKLVSFYGMASPDPIHMENRMEKVRQLIASMGDKYLLAKPIEKIIKGE